MSGKMFLLKCLASSTPTLVKKSLNLSGDTSVDEISTLFLEGMTFRKDFYKLLTFVLIICLLK